MLCWDDKTGDVKVVMHPDTFRLSRGLSAVGACCLSFNKMTKAKKIQALLSEAIWLIGQGRVDAKKMHDALMQINEVRDVINGDPFQP